jgi:hypothetical protein
MKLIEETMMLRWSALKTMMECEGGRRLCAGEYTAYDVDSFGSIRVPRGLIKVAETVLRTTPCHCWKGIGGHLQFEPSSSSATLKARLMVFSNWLDVTSDPNSDILYSPL